MTDGNYPPDDWLLDLNFYLIVNSGDLSLTTCDFEDARLYEAYQENPGRSFQDMNATATKLVLEFQVQKQDTEVKISPNGVTHVSPLAGEETSTNGALSVPMPDLSDHV